MPKVPSMSRQSADEKTRIVIAVTETTRLPVLWKAAARRFGTLPVEVVTLFLEDDRWVRAASLPFTREISRLSGSSAGVCVGSQRQPGLRNPVGAGPAEGRPLCEREAALAITALRDGRSSRVRVPDATRLPGRGRRRKRPLRRKIAGLVGPRRRRLQVTPSSCRHSASRPRTTRLPFKGPRVSVTTVHCPSRCSRSWKYSTTQSRVMPRS